MPYPDTDLYPSPGLYPGLAGAYRRGGLQSVVTGTAVPAGTRALVNASGTRVAVSLPVSGATVTEPLTRVVIVDDEPVTAV